MISYINGILTEKLGDGVIIEAGGLGYHVKTTSATMESLELGPRRLITRQITKETGSELFGFGSEEERFLFDLLTNHVSGVGPKTALNILNATNPIEFKSAVVAGDVERLAKTKGLGRKGAERIIIELRDKVKITEIWEARETEGDHSIQDAILALMALGQTRATAERAVTAAKKAKPEADAETLIREALRQ